MGRVYLCRDTDLDVEVAIKVLPAEVAAEEDALEQIRKEARAAARFRDCPGILSLYGFERHGDTRYIVMEYAAGGSLYDRLKRERVLPEAECRRLGSEVADALAFAHRRQVIHRDIKPANLLLDASGCVKVADFGIAKILSDTSARLSQFTTAGTPDYMAPEIVLGQRADGRADLFALGVMLYEMATGERPYKGSQGVAQKMIPGAEAPDPRALKPEITEGYAVIVRALLAQKPEDRFPDAAACAAALRERPEGEAPGISVSVGTEFGEEGVPPPGDRAQSPGTVLPQELPPTAVVPRGPRVVPGIAPTAALRRKSRIPVVAGVLVLAGVVAVVFALSQHGSSPGPSGGTPSGGDPPPVAPPGGGEGPENVPGPDAGKAPEVAAVKADGPAGAAEGEHVPQREEKPPAEPPMPPASPPLAHGLHVFTDPPGATVIVDGVEKGVAGIGGLPIPDADPSTPHVVRAFLDEHDQGEERGVTWKVGERKEVRLTLAPLSGFLRIEGGPPGATVRASRAGAESREFTLAEDGTVGPVAVDVGEYDLTVSKKGFETWEGKPKERVAPSRTAKVTVTLRERDGTLSLATEPPGAEVYEGTTLLGATPLRQRRLTAGKHIIRLVHPDTDELVRDVEIRGDEPLDLGRVTLPALATLDLTGLPADVRATVDGKSATGTQARKPGVVTVVFVKPKHRDQSVLVELHAGERSTPRPATWLPRPGRLDFSALDPEAEITLDGKSVRRRGRHATLGSGSASSVSASEIGSRLSTLQVNVGEVKSNTRLSELIQYLSDLSGVRIAMGDGVAKDRVVGVPASPSNALGGTLTIEDILNRVTRESGMGWEVRGDGVEITVGGDWIEVEPGPHVVALKREGFRPVEDRTVQVGPEETVSIPDVEWARLVTVTPAVPGLAPPPPSVLQAQQQCMLPKGFVRSDDGRIYCEKDGAEMVLVAEGAFAMGSSDGSADESPIHSVRVSAFLVDRHEVTNAQFEKFVAETSYRTDAELAGVGEALDGSKWSKVAGASWRQPQGPSSVVRDGGAFPVVLVSWRDAVAYGEWAGRRLPTEAEFEKALRGGIDGMKYPWGVAETPPERVGNYRDMAFSRSISSTSHLGEYDDGHVRASPVGTFQQNALGLFDVSGNVAEWCADWYAIEYYAQSTSRDPKGPASGSLRVVRGGSWTSRAEFLRTSDRNWVAPTKSVDDRGFRCAVNLK